MAFAAGTVLGREACALCGSGENLEPFDYHAYARRTHYGELPRGLGLRELLKIFQGQTVYHQLVQLSVLICARCVRKMRCRRAARWAFGIGLLIGLSVLAWIGHSKFMLRFAVAQEAMDQLEQTRVPSSPRKELRQIDADPRYSDRLEERMFDQQAGELQRKKDHALLFAIPLGVGSLIAGALAIVGFGWAFWDLRWERMGQRAAVKAVRAECQNQGLKYVYPGHLHGGQPLTSNSLE